MSIYFFRMSKLSRTKGRSSVAAVAYLLSKNLVDERTGLRFNYSRKRGVVDSGVEVPTNARWATEPSTLWNAVEAAETRINSNPARELILALPCELSTERNGELVRDMAKLLVGKYSVATTWALHAPDAQGDTRNVHAHLLFSAREITANGVGRKVRILDDRKSGPQQVEFLREQWASLCNQALVTQSKPAVLDHRSYLRQQLPYVGGVHLGAQVMRLTRMGIATPKFTHQQRIEGTNMNIKSLIVQIDKNQQSADTLKQSLIEEPDPSKNDRRSFSPTEDVAQDVELRLKPFELYAYRSKLHEAFPALTIGTEWNGFNVRLGGMQVVNDRGERLFAGTGSVAEIVCMLKLADLKRWPTLHLNGPQAFKRSAWEAAMKAGYTAESITGYIPSSGEIDAAYRMKQMLASRVRPLSEFVPAAKVSPPLSGRRLQRQ